MVIIRKLVLHIPLLFILPMFMTNKVLAVVLSAPVSDILSVVVTVACFLPGFYRKMKNPDHFDGEKISLSAEN
ncbi:MAG: hypothetical protein IKH75_06140 [Ruminococcus sp.]|nr:hypothetical protein [Ruminococcus sp.]